MTDINLLACNFIETLEQSTVHCFLLIRAAPSGLSAHFSLSFADIDADGDVDAFGNHAGFFLNMGVEQVVFQHTVIVTILV
jgi:hypothetical protein